ncbi:MAG: SDR family NAD(P)-dependent oxidoreductase [Candidatus Izemoplasmatales bacterium]
MKVIITGAAGGLGRAFVNECVKRGYEVFATDINLYGLKLIQEGIYARYGKKINIIETDIRSDQSVGALFQEMKNKQFKPDLLLNVAGIDYEGRFSLRPFSELQKIIEINVIGTMRMIHSFIDADQDNKHRYIINIASLAAEQPIPLKATYAASKRFLIHFGSGIREELKTNNIHLLSVCPAGLATNPEVIKAIHAQGFFGAISTCHIEQVVSRSIDYCLQGKKKYVPGGFNQLTVILNKFIPTSLTTKILYKRWNKAQKLWLK